MKRKFKNIKTGAILYSSSKISGKNWIELTENKEENIGDEEKVETVEEIKEEKEKVTDNKDETDDIDGITKKEIMQELDAMGIEYNPRATKKELYELMMQGR